MTKLLGKVDNLRNDTCRVADDYISIYRSPEQIL